MRCGLSSATFMMSSPNSALTHANHGLVYVFALFLSKLSWRNPVPAELLFRVRNAQEISASLVDVKAYMTIDIGQT
jgi:hypothetical protein